MNKVTYTEICKNMFPTFLRHIATDFLKNFGPSSCYISRNFTLCTPICRNGSSFKPYFIAHSRHFRVWIRGLLIRRKKPVGKYPETELKNDYASFR